MVGLFVPFLRLVRFFGRCSKRVGVVLLRVLRTVMVIGSGVYIGRGVFLDSRALLEFGVLVFTVHWDGRSLQ